MIAAHQTARGGTNGGRCRRRSDGVARARYVAYCKAFADGACCVAAGQPTGAGTAAVDIPRGKASRNCTVGVAPHQSAGACRYADYIARGVAVGDVASSDSDCAGDRDCTCTATHQPPRACAITLHVASGAAVADGA